MISINDIEQLRRYFAPKILGGKTLPNPREVVDGTTYYLKVSGVEKEHIMRNGKWYIKKINASNEIYLVEV